MLWRAAAYVHDPARQETQAQSVAEDVACLLPLVQERVLVQSQPLRRGSRVEQVTKGEAVTSKLRRFCAIAVVGYGVVTLGAAWIFLGWDDTSILIPPCCFYTAFYFLGRDTP